MLKNKNHTLIKGICELSIKKSANHMLKNYDVKYCELYLNMLPQKRCKNFYFN